MYFSEVRRDKVTENTMKPCPICGKSITKMENNMARFYYKCPLEAAYMSKYYNIRYVDNWDKYEKSREFRFADFPRPSISGVQGR